MDLVQEDKNISTRHAARAGHVEESEPVNRRSPIKLRGRGCFTHPHSVDRGRENLASTPADAMDSLTSRMSSLQFVPHSVRMARGRGRGRGQ